MKEHILQRNIILSKVIFMIKVFSMFSGIGGFELGILNSIIADDVEFISHSEIDKYAEDVYQRHFGGKNYGDATRINTDVW